MRYLLIDTNSLLDLLEVTEEENFKLLQHWVDSEKLRLLVPERLVEEWNRQRDRHLQAVREVHNKAAKNVNASVRKIMEAALQRILQKAAWIDTALREGEQCQVTKVVDAEVGRRYRKGLAPFHINRDSHGDAYIYFTTVGHLRKKRQNGFLFITRDKTAFSLPEIKENSKENEKEIHPDLKVEGLEVTYLFTLQLGIHRIRQQIGGITNELVDQDTDHDDIFYLFPGAEKYALPDQAYHALNAYYDQLPFIPTRLLVKVFPFKIRDVLNYHTYHSSFYINTNNKALVELFRALNISQQKRIRIKKRAPFAKIEDCDQKLHTILERLNQNLINGISAINAGIEANIAYHNPAEDDAQDLFNQLDFLGAYTALKEHPPKDLREATRQAYLYFQFGNFQKSLEFFDYAYEKARQSGKNLLAFICCYNMKRLKELVKGHYTAIDPKAHAIIRKINKVSIKRFRIDYVNESPFVQEVMALIATGDFYHEGLVNLDEVVENIRKHYELQLRGGTSRNSHYHVLLSTFGEIDFFLEQNCVVFNNYSNYFELVEKFAEGLFMTYSFSEKQPNRLVFIHNYLLLKIIPYARREELIRLYNRYHLQGIKHGNGDMGDVDFLAITLKLVHDYPQLMARLQHQNTYTFWDRYNKIFGNLLLVLTLSKDTPDLSTLIEALAKLMREESFLRKFDDKFIADLLREKGRYCSTASLQLFLNEAIDNPKLHEPAIFSALQIQANKHHPQLLIEDKKTYKRLIDTFFKKCPKCNAYHHKDIGVSCFKLLTPQFQQKLATRLLRSLSTDFDADDYYTYAIYGIIDYKRFWHRFMASCPRVERKEHGNFWGKSEASYTRLNELINLAYKCNIDLSSAEFDKYRGIAPYYDWLMNLQGFNYRRFNPEWILEYQTTIYFRKIFSVHKVREALATYLLRTKHPILSNLFLRYTQPDI